MHGEDGCTEHVKAENDLSTPTPAPPHKGEEKRNYAASALAGFSGGVIAPDNLMSATSLSE